MEYTDVERALIIGRALALAQCEQRRKLGILMDNHPDIFKAIISEILVGAVAYEYQIKDMVVQLAKSYGYKPEFIEDKK
jgi:hypothetical protein